MATPDIEELTRRIREQLNQEQEVDIRVNEIEEEIEGIVDTAEKLTTVVQTFIPTDGDSRIVVDTLEEWLLRAKKSMVAERLVERHGLRPYDPEEIEDLIENKEEYQWKAADLSHLIREDPKPEPEPSNNIETPNLTVWLLIGLTALQTASIILLLR